MALEYMIYNNVNGITALLTFEDRYATLVCGDMFQVYSDADAFATLNYFDMLPTHSVVEIGEDN
jgi:hypothetical protein